MFCYDFLGTSIVASISAYHVVDRGSTTAPTPPPPSEYIYFFNFQDRIFKRKCESNERV